MVCMYVSYELKRPLQIKIIPALTISERSESQIESAFMFLRYENPGGMIIANREKKSIYLQ